MSIQSNFPAIKPTLLLDFANVKALDPRITFTRASTATYFDQLGVMQTAASGVARFDHNPLTDESLGLLIEEQRTNLLLYSQEFDNAYWGKTDSSITPNVIVSPDGTINADLFSSDATVTATARDLRRSSTTTVSVANTFSVYAKAAGGNFIVLTIRNASAAGNNCTAEFNLSNGTISVAAANNGNATGATASITSTGNGWYRCSISGIADTSGTSLSTLIFGRTSSGQNSVAASTSLCYIWSAQLEVGAFSTSYIPTVASQVIRSADAASITGTNFSSWYSQGEGTIYAEGFLNNPAVTGAGMRRLADINDGSNNNRISFGAAQGAAVLRTQYAVSGVNINGTNGQTASNVFPSAKVAVAYKAADYAFSPNGAAPTTSTAASVPVVDRLSIGNDFAATAGGSANGTIKKIAYYPMRLINAQLQALTS